MNGKPSSAVKGKQRKIGKPGSNHPAVEDRYLVIPIKWTTRETMYFSETQYVELYRQSVLAACMGRAICYMHNICNGDTSCNRGSCVTRQTVFKPDRQMQAALHTTDPSGGDCSVNST